ncbi:hypothetical protein FOC1_g10013174 [Fusarium oxysporum f. sp. cubense race 1]|uniref:Alpha/beta hydrolase fold-3 domain-containing protein n=1 Tax=Fusarium oxysporum f. sp. cubense (strain race 1) TaxID=1229664 RepID=N4U9J8_FUSC1|nr:hypothetical protein FOC1_g10013174 [Fusarium oxysporum f. sp. cubense race 1]
MLQALYPQKWLPYQYLWPFLRNHLDSWANLGMIAKRFPDTPPGIYIVEAGKDELVPANHGEELLQRCRQVGLPVERQKVRGALHNEAMPWRTGILSVCDKKCRHGQPYNGHCHRRCHQISGRLLIRALH